MFIASRTFITFHAYKTLYFISLFLSLFLPFSIYMLYIYGLGLCFPSRILCVRLQSDKQSNWVANKSGSANHERPSLCSLDWFSQTSVSSKVNLPHRFTNDWFSTNFLFFIYKDPNYKDYLFLKETLPTKIIYSLKRHYL